MVCHQHRGENLWLKLLPMKMIEKNTELGGTVNFTEAQKVEMQKYYLDSPVPFPENAGLHLTVATLLMLVTLLKVQRMDRLNVAYKK